MRKIMLIACIVGVMTFFGVMASNAQTMGPGMMGPGYGYGYGMGPGMMGPGYGPHGWNYCPYCGGYMGPGHGYGMGPGMMGRGYGMGPGMMHRGWGMGPQHGPQYGPQYQGPGYPQPQKPMEEKDAKELVENYLKSARNPNLKLGKIEDKGDSFSAEILTNDGSLVDKLAVDKTTGWMRSIY